ncbi:ubiquitin-protein ligase peroxin 12, partial [Irineochytrium annulatum]
MERVTAFELMAASRMAALLKPASRYVLTVYAQRYPRYLLRLANNFNTLFAVATAIVEGHYLWKWGGSCAEKFYGLKRVPAAVRASATGSLTAWNKWVSLILLVVPTFLESILDEMNGPAASSRFIQEPDEAERPWTLRDYFFRRIYPTLKGALNGLDLAFQLAYICNATDYFSTSLALAGVKVARLTPYDYKTIEGPAAKPTATSSRAPSENILRSLILNNGSTALKTLLPLSIFLFKFLEWWYASDFHKHAKQYPVAPPPPLIA